jgi:uncharacterized protein (TIGR00156 family)
MKRILFALLLAPFISTTSFAAGGYNGPSTSEAIATVAAATEARDNADVVLQGKVVRKLKNDLYEFRDKTGSISVEIDDDVWPTQSISEQTLVKLVGEVDRDLFDRKIDVDLIEVIE